MQGTIQSLFHDAILYDEPYTAHLIYYVLGKGKVNMKDCVSRLYEVTFSDEELREFEEVLGADVLNMRPVKLYAVKRSGGSYVFYFAKNPREVQNLHYELYREWVNKLINAYEQMIDKSLYFPETGETKTFRELMKETVEFPRWVGEW